MHFRSAPWIGAFLAASLLDVGSGFAAGQTLESQAGTSPEQRTQESVPSSLDAPNLVTSSSKRKRGIRWTPSAFVTGGLIGLSFMVAPQAPSDARWSSPILADGAFRRWLELPAGGTREAVATVSDVGLFTNTIAPLASYGLVAMLSSKRRSYAHVNRAMIGTQAFLGNLIVTNVLKAAVGRQRPTAEYGNESFPSGHASTAFTGAFLLLSEASPFAGEDLKALRYTLGVTTLAVATASSVLRISAGRHNLSDIAAGAGLGFFFGFIYPKLLGNGEENEPNSRPMPIVDPFSPNGPSVSMRFALP